LNKIKYAVLALLMCVSVTLFAGNKYVKHDASGNNDGSSWTHAYTSLQSALSTASSGDKIYVATGTYVPSNEVGGTGNSYNAFQLIDGVALYGGLAGTEDMSTYDLDDRDFSTNETILSGDLGSGNYAYHVFRHVSLALTSATILDGFTISDAKADGSGDDANGAGMLNAGAYSSHCDPSIVNCTFVNNEADYGAAIYNARYSNPDVSHTSFQNNTATILGGAVYNARNTAAFTHCTFNSNTVSSTSEDHGGGAIYSTTSNSSEGLTISHCSFENNTVNTSFGKGGAIRGYINPGKMTIDNCSFLGNEALYGGAVYCNSGSSDNRDNSDIQISNSSFEENEATYGGAVFSDRHNMVLTTCKIRGNEASSQAGGFYSRYAASKLINTLISGNKSLHHAGGIYFNTETGAEIINSTISGNNSGDRGGAISLINSSTISVDNSILWGNSSGSGNNVYVSAACTVNVDYSLYGNAAGDVNVVSGGAWNATNSLTSNPDFTDPLTATSGNTPNLSGDYTLKNTSPAIDAASNANLPAGVSYDLEGNDRIIDGDDNVTATIDMGAYEYDPPEVPLPISLLYFRADKTKHGVKLTWETASETNNAAFIIYRNERPIARMDGAGTSSEPHFYEYTDVSVVPGRSYTYILADMDFENKIIKHDAEAVNILVSEEIIAAEFFLGENYPNPFNPGTSIDLYLSQSKDIILSVYDVNGREVEKLIEGIMPAGQHSFYWNASGHESGIYFYRLISGDLIQTRKMVLMK